ncbi:hypothetical protein V8J82_18710 [Gymnodinialimonas sp. 2305UL16-5]|uniref:hypothetical protein n=1 Tax=Gymnodinialimonas mytili TaxID=3126503 RepID=UPI0030B5A747
MAALLTAPTAKADMPDDPLTFFANCAGRLSAELSFRWLFSDPSADQVEAMRQTTLDIVAALTPPGEARTVLNRRIEAHAAHSALLTRAHFTGDAWASDHAARSLMRCARYVLDPGDLAWVDAPLRARLR